jgi:hypothetical protein
MSTSRRLFGTQTDFLGAFPNVESVRVDLEESGNFPIGQSPHMRKRSLRNNEVGSSLRCSNPRCKQGGYSIEVIVSSMVAQRESAKELTVRCNGHEGSPKGRRRGDPCYNRIKGEVQITYKSGDTPKT